MGSWWTSSLMVFFEELQAEMVPGLGKKIKGFQCTAFLGIWVFVFHMYLSEISYVNFLSIVEERYLSCLDPNRLLKKWDKIRFCRLCFGPGGDGGSWKKIFALWMMRCAKSISMPHRHCLSADDFLLFHQIVKKLSSSACSLKVFCRSPLHNRTEK